MAEERAIPTQTVRRLPVYLKYLERQTSPYISAAAIAEAFGLGGVQVRKDLAAVSAGGRSGVGYETGALIADLRRALSCEKRRKAVLAGAGNLGRAILGYAGFEQCGMDIVAAFDANPAVTGERVGGVPVLPAERLSEVCVREGAELGIVTVPEQAAQEVCERMVKGGVRAIWNFAPTLLRVPEGVILQNENLAASLLVLSKCLETTGEQKTI